ncbi:MAG: tetratricopeptide repeat protein [Nitrospirae bacterium]|nr:tetratricopeptide repeat protein [Nitrospirota bacterium]
MYILGINAFYHDAAAALLKDGRTVAMAEEERFTRSKHAEGAFPHNAINFCLRHEGIDFKDINYLTFMHDIEAILSYDPTVEPIKSSFAAHPDLYEKFRKTFEGHLDYLKTYCREKGLMLKIVPHHDCHLASAFFGSDFDEANIISIDGRGDKETAVLAYGKGNSIKKLLSIPMPHSLGLIYTAVTDFLGFRPFDGEGKVMGLAPYGKDRFGEIFKDIIWPTSQGFETKTEYYYPLVYGFVNGRSRMEETFGNRRLPQSNSINGIDEDIACSLQARTEEIVSHLVDLLYSMTGCKNLCLAGGVALNAKMNGKLFKKSNVENIYIQPIANDAGCALGGPMHLYNELTGTRPEKISSVYLGPAYDNDSLRSILKKSGHKYMESSDIITDCAAMLAEGKIVGWFQGRMEVGPRALGNRSILADPSSPGMKDRINNKVKRRESWRPFAASILSEYKEEYLENAYDGPFMILNFGVTEKAKRDLASAIHVDFTTRPHTVSKDRNPLYYNLIKEFGRSTGVYGLLNTSFNLAGEPIVLTPEDAYKDLVNSDMDAVVIGDFILEKQGKKKIVTSGYSVTKKDYKLSFDQYQRYRMVTDIINKARSKSALNILDIGSGPINISEFLPCDKIARLDTESRNEEWYVCGSALKMPFQDGSFDVVISCDMFEHIKPHERETFLDEINRVSKDMFIIACPFSSGDVEKAEAMVNSFYKNLFGHEHKWLIEHRNSGLPSLEDLKTWIHAKGYGADVLHNGSLDTWLPMMFLGTYLEKQGEWEIFFRLNNIYIHEIYSGDNYPPSYRNIVVVKKTLPEVKDKVSPGKICVKKDLPGMIRSSLKEKIKEDAGLLFDSINEDHGADKTNELVRSIAVNEYLLRSFRERVEEYVRGTGSDDAGLTAKMIAFTGSFKALLHDFLDDLSGHYRTKSVNADTSIKILCKYIESRPDSGKAWNNLGVVLSEMGNTDEAKSAFFNACLLDYPAAYRNLWHLYIVLQDAESAGKIMNEGLKKGLDMVCFDALSIHNMESFSKEAGLLAGRIKPNRGIINALQEEKEKLTLALEKYRRFTMIAEKLIKEKDAHIANARSVIAGSKQELKLISETVREVKSAIPVIRSLTEHLGREDDVTGLMVKLGEICFSLGSADDARFFFEKAVALDSRNCDALNNLGVLNLQKGDYKTAKDFFNKALNEDPGNKEARINLRLVNEMIVDKNNDYSLKERI